MSTTLVESKGRRQASRANLSQEGCGPAARMGAFNEHRAHLGGFMNLTAKHQSCFRAAVYALVIIVALPLAAGCGPGAKRNKAEETIEKYYAAVKKQDYEKTTAYFASDYFKRNAKRDWIKQLTLVNKNMGALKSYERSEWKILKKQDSDGVVRKYVALQYKVQYEEATATETFTCVFADEKTPKIWRYLFIGSDGTHYNG